MHRFNFLRPESAEEACALLAKIGDRAKIIAGGQSLVILLKQRLISPEYLIYINNLKELDYMRLDDESNLRIGALTSHRTLETAPLIKKEFRVLAEAERNLASIQIRNCGTIGGNICHGDPASDIVPPLIALEATVKAASLSGIREIPLEGLFRDYYETILRPDEILTEICIPQPRGYTGVVCSKYSLRRVDMAAVAVAISITMDPDRRVCIDSRIVLGAVSSVPRRAFRSENLMKMKRMDERLISETARMASEEVEPVSDIYFSGEYKREIIKLMVRDGIIQVIRRMSGIGQEV